VAVQWSSERVVLLVVLAAVAVVLNSPAVAGSGNPAQGFLKETVQWR
jgi:hypothetical protein